MAVAQDASLKWSSQLRVTPPRHTPKRLPGDKITLPQSALEQLLAAAPVQAAPPTSGTTGSLSTRPYTRTFDPFNPHTFAAEARAREQHDFERQYHQQQQQPQLPHPLTFRIVNPVSGRVVFAGIQEFSASEGEVGLSAFLRDALGIEDDQFSVDVDGFGERNGTETAAEDADGYAVDMTSSHGPTVTVHAQQLPKGTYVRLRPLEAGYDPEDWKALLERYLRENFTTLTLGELLTVPVPGRTRHESFRFMVDRFRPDGDGICVVDTDLEVDIEALTEEQARETLKKRLEKTSRAVRPGTGTDAGSSIGGELTVGAEVAGQIVPGDYVDYEIKTWNREQLVGVELEFAADDGDVDLLVSQLSARQRNRPRIDEHVFADVSSTSPKRIIIRPTNVHLEDAEVLYISVYAYAETPQLDVSTAPVRYTLRVSTGAEDVELNDGDEPSPHDAGDVQCQNCHQWVPQRTLVLHENFCFRNNIRCDKCGQVFQKRSAEWENHWHCPLDPSHGNDAASKRKHDTLHHQVHACPNCAFETHGLLNLAQHRTSTCPAKPILCQFCHLVVPQQGDSDPDVTDPEVILSGLTPHEVVDGGRTTECHLCNKIVRLRELKTHLRHHDLERVSRSPPRICLNRNCGRTVDGRGTQSPKSAAAGNESLGLCSICFGPLYVDTYDPEGKALRRRIERRYLTQMMTGCGKPWCQNQYCKTGRQNTAHSASEASASVTPSAADILAMIRPLVEAINFRPHQTNTAPFFFCTDQASQQRRILAETLAAEGQDEASTVLGGTAKAKAKAKPKVYTIEWCIAAVEAAGGDLDKAREWLANWAPAKGETATSHY